MIRRFFEDQKILVVTGAVSFAGFLILAIVMLFDQTQILGINRWIKPIKFFVSIAVYVWTIAVYFQYLPGWEIAKRRISITMAVIFAVEQLAVVGQAARGTTSHFNVGNPFDGMVYAVMGVAIAFNTILAAVIAWKYFTVRIDLPRPIVIGLQLGLVLFLLGSIEGAYMAAQTGHTVGGADGGPGLPLVNWSTVAGDLRVAHFLGMHGLQTVPIAAWLVNRALPRVAAPTVVAFSIIYAVFVGFLFVQALNGRPFLTRLF